MLKKILDYVKKYSMIEAGDTIVAGISGGADSVCLLFVLQEIRKEFSFDLEVVHINHGIRKEAGEDADFVKKLCEEKEIPFFLVEENIKERAKQSGLSEEEEGRRVRYRAFGNVLGARKGKIAVAHNSNDRAETMLFHLFRGTGLAGAAGIPPVNGQVIRPLLCVSREEIEQWLAERNITYCIDCTNAQDIYTRNRIRHHILGYAKEHVCRGTVKNMNRAAEQLLEAEDYLAGQTLEAAGRCVKTENDEQCELLQEESQDILQERSNRVCIKIPEFLKEHAYMQSRLLLWCFEQAAGSKKDLSAAHVNSVRELFAKQGNGQLHLPYELVVYKKYDLGMIQRRTSLENAVPLKKEYEISLPAVGESVQYFIEGFGNLEITAFFAEKKQNIPEKTYTKWMDYDKITKSVMFRTKRPGDYLTINSKMGHKSLQDYFVNEKVPREEREHIYILAEQDHVLWVPKYRISEYYKVTEHTCHILQITILGAAKEERSHKNG